MAETSPGGIAFDTTVPVTQASADAAAVGVAAAAARRDHRHGMPTITAGAVTRAGGNTTEATTTSTTAVDVLSVSSLSILAVTPIFLFGNGRKTTGAANSGRMGLKLNSTVVILNGGLWRTSATDESENGTFLLLLNSRVTNYDWPGAGTFGAFGAANFQSDFNAFDAAVPIATITDVVLQGRSADALITTGFDELNVYTLATS